MPFLGNIGAPELIIIAVIALVIFGPGKLPEVAQSLGRGVREFRKAASDVTEATKLEPTPTPTPAPPPTSVASTPTPAVPAAAPAVKPATESAEPPSGDAGQSSA